MLFMPTLASYRERVGSADRPHSETISFVYCKLMRVIETQSGVQTTVGHFMFK
jgi:hypothetical protein